MIYKRELTDEEIKCLAHFVPDVQAWIDEAIAQKIEGCKKRILRQEVERALDNNLPIPSTSSEILDQVFAQPDYKNRKQKIDEDEKPAEIKPMPEPVEENGESVKTPI